MAVCEVGDKKALVTILVVLQLSMVALMGKYFLDSGNTHIFRFRNEFVGRYRKHNATKLILDSKKQDAFTKNDVTEVPTPEVSQLFAKIKENAVYKHFKVLSREKRERTNLLVIVSSAPKRMDRRDAIRETWWSLCKSTSRVKVTCLFMTDHQNPGDPYEKQLAEEAAKHKDMEYQVLGGGVEFGKRFIYHMLWAVKNFEFDYFMRLDDDYFLCFDKVINELPMPPLKLFHWGWVHCINGITRPEESVIVFSKDVIETFLLQDPEKMRCHPWADQQIGLWVQDLGWTHVLKWRHDPRLHHDPPVRNLPHFLNDPNACGRLGYHGSYPDAMRTLWNHRGKYELKKETFLETSNVCQSDLLFDWAKFINFWRYEPRLCKTNPVWDTSKQGGGKNFGGRQEGLGRKKRSLFAW